MTEIIYLSNDILFKKVIELALYNYVVNVELIDDESLLKEKINSANVIILDNEFSPNPEEIINYCISEGKPVVFLRQIFSEDSFTESDKELLVSLKKPFDDLSFINTIKKFCSLKLKTGEEKMTDIKKENEVLDNEDDILELTDIIEETADDVSDILSAKDIVKEDAETAVPAKEQEESVFEETLDDKLKQDEPDDTLNLFEKSDSDNNEVFTFESKDAVDNDDEPLLELKNGKLEKANVETDTEKPVAELKDEDKTDKVNVALEQVSSEEKPVFEKDSKYSKDSEDELSFEQTLEKEEEEISETEAPSPDFDINNNESEAADISTEVVEPSHTEGAVPEDEKELKEVEENLTEKEITEHTESDTYAGEALVEETEMTKEEDISTEQLFEENIVQEQEEVEEDISIPVDEETKKLASEIDNGFDDKGGDKDDEVIAMEELNDFKETFKDSFVKDSYSEKRDSKTIDMSMIEIKLIEASGKVLEAIEEATVEIAKGIAKVTPKIIEEVSKEIIPRIAQKIISEELNKVNKEDKDT
jgi:hypothetical protein